MDDIDRKILRERTDDASLANQDLAARVDPKRASQDPSRRFAAKMPKEIRPSHLTLRQYRCDKFFVYKAHIGTE